MKVKVVAPFEVAGLDADGCLELPDGARVADLLKRSGPAGRFFTILPVMVNGDQVPASHLLKDEDVVVVVFPIGGG